MVLSIASGKGGTGKTVLTASFAALAENKVMVDCDVDAADLHLLLHPEIKVKNEFRGGKTALIDKELCTECGKCREVCRFYAIGEDFVVDSILCEGCHLCDHICPVHAVRMEENISGEWFISETKYGPFIHARLGITEENSGKLVSKIRDVAKEIAETENHEYVIIDGPPGTGCPVFASLSGSDLALIVTEPTVSGIYDMQRVLDVTEHFNIKAKAIINKYDLNLQNKKRIERFCKERHVEVAGHIPFSLIVNKSIINGMPIVEYCSDGLSIDIVAIWHNIIGD